MSLASRSETACTVALFKRNFLPDMAELMLRRDISNTEGRAMLVSGGRWLQMIDLWADEVLNDTRGLRMGRQELGPPPGHVLV